MTGRQKSQQQEELEDREPRINLREELLDIYERHGKLTPAIVLEEAEDEDSPLHHRFEWDDGEAAHRYRLYQARHLILQVKIRVQPENTASPLIRAFLHVPNAYDGEDADDADDGGGTGYQNYMRFSYSQGTRT